MIRSSFSSCLPEILAITATILLFTEACNNLPQDKKNQQVVSLDSSYTLTGKITGLDSGWICLQYLETDSAMPASDSARIQEGVFTFKGFCSRPQWVMLEVPGTGSQSNRGHPLAFFLDKGLILVNANKDTLYKAVITGSRSQDEYLSLLNSLDSLDPEQNKLDSLYQRAIKANNQRLLDSLQNEFNGLEQCRKDQVRTYVLGHPASYVGAYETVRYFSYLPEPGPLDTLYRALTHNVQESYYGKKIKEIREIARLLDIGQPAPDFSQPDLHDNLVSLASFKGKYILLDFWASWCGPCRRESPSLLKAYRRFHSKGFEIVGVSLDDNKKNWLDAISKDQLNWTQVSDLKGGANEAAHLYGITGIPMNFLLNPDGRIIAKGLRGGQLERKLAELMP